MKYDFAIIGAGFAGMSLSIILAEKGYKVLLLEKRNLKEFVSGNDPYGRAFAIAKGTRNILEKYNLWDEFAVDAGIIKEIRITDGPTDIGASILDFDHKLVGDEPLGHMVENKYMLPILYERLMAQENVTLLDELAEHELVIDPHKAVIKALGKEYKAGLLIAADGKFSATRDFLGIDTYGWDYDQIALVLSVSHQTSHHHVAQERFLSGGPFAVLPLKNELHSSLVWSEKAEVAKEFLKLDQESKKEIIQEKFGHHFGCIEIISEIFAYPLSVKFAYKAFAERSLLIADAYHSIHPLAGQGLNLGFRDIDALVQLIEEYTIKGYDIGDQIFLEAYETSRKQDNTNMMLICDSINKIFSNNNPILKKARRFGINTANHLPKLQAKLMRYAMGE